MKFKCDTSMSIRILLPVVGVIIVLTGIRIWWAWFNANNEKNRLIESDLDDHVRLMNQAAIIDS
ncbi:hypothetical protein DBT_0132 [Dissulfuribacter thermophilus]|uniref:Uncharacterized protein n=1 Tax=Dissulfuribacter thermophilus TaxID=1156395 RepID=A0A1B9F908_9BACT|nr:hypothetical protein [Dissulfuribacter thermophilus]OCC16315.1 hypothetical protein DBT_0132 [Dissulfuribacter thermophilus]